MKKIDKSTRWERAHHLVTEYSYSWAEAFRLADDQPAGGAKDYDDAICRAEDDRAERQAFAGRTPFSRPFFLNPTR